MRDIIKYVWVVVILFSGFISNAQVVSLQIVDQESQNLFFSELRSSRSNTLNYADINGSPYYSDDFKLSDIYFKNGNIIKQVSVRLNLYDNILEFQRGNEILELTRMEDLGHVKINEEDITFVNDVDDSGDAGFYKIELDGKYQLLQLLQVTYFDPIKATNHYEDDIPAKFKKQNGKYYLGTEKNTPLEFGNKKDFQDSFAQSYTSLVKYAKKNKLNPKNYDDLVIMVNYLNSNDDKSAN